MRGRDAQQARQLLHDEQLARMRDPAARDWKIEAVRQHFSEGPSKAFTPSTTTSPTVFSTSAPRAR
ncbi:hypothetical protein L843_5503 [Mycobacterium intracellulare MIN_061107_1834]|nr:hypothetical protein L843_5503 [Mycobacterium intracellulare MIN_061107_1834]